MRSSQRPKARVDQPVGARTVATGTPSAEGPVAASLTRSGSDAAAATYHRLAAVEPPEFDLDDEEFVKAVWGAIELHRTSLVWPLLRVWTELRPDASAAWTMTGWAYQVDGHLDLARTLLRRALNLDPHNHEAAVILTSLPRGDPVGVGHADGGAYLNRLGILPPRTVRCATAQDPHGWIARRCWHVAGST